MQLRTYGENQKTSMVALRENSSSLTVTGQVWLRTKSSLIAASIELKNQLMLNLAKALIPLKERW